MPKFLSRLSATLYKTLKRRGVPVPREQYQRARLKSAAKGEWGQVKVALLDEISVSRNSSTARLLNRKLLDRIEALDDSATASPMTTALFDNGPALREKVDPTVAIDITDDKDLTDSQNEALRKGVDNRLLVLLGAASTGKTRVTTKLIQKFVTAGQTTLLCCYTKAALTHTVNHLDNDTCTSIFFRARTFGSLVMEEVTTEFDNIVVDEAGIANIAYVLYLSSICRHRLIFVGDPMQLGPIASTDREQSPWLRLNIFQRLSRMENLSQLYSWQENNSDLAVLLRDQFEVPERIFNVINHFCYGNRLNNRTQGRGLISIIDTSALSPPLIGSRRSPVNAVHAEIVVSTLRDLLTKQSITAEDIGIITPFRAQSRHIKHLMASRGLPALLEIGTPYEWQGRMKSVVVLDLTVSGVDHQFRALSEDNQAMALMNASLTRCRTDRGTEGRLIVVCNLAHVDAAYGDSAVTRFLDRLTSNADSITKPTEAVSADHGLTNDDTQRYAELTDALVRQFSSKYQTVSESLAGNNLPDESEVETLIWKGYDLIPRLIGLCNRLKASNQANWFDLSDDNMEALEQPIAALELANLSEDVRFSPGRISHFRAVVSDLYMALYESTMVKSPSGRNQNPPEPVFDPDALGAESYGRIRVFLKDLRNHQEHDQKKWEDWQRQNNKVQRDLFFQRAINKSAPEKPQDYSSIDYLRAVLFALKEAVNYLDTVRTKLKQRS